MISFEEARRTVFLSAKVLPIEHVPLRTAFGRVLARDAAADRAVPQAALSAMDGFACRRADLTGTLKVVETIAAGQTPHKTISVGECARIMTGALVPEGADWVVQSEHCHENGGEVTVISPCPKSNIRAVGEDLAAGELVLQHGTLLTPQAIAVLASVGCDPVPVYIRPTVGIIATGSELVDPSDTPDIAHIRNSATAQLCAQVARCGCFTREYGIVPDNRNTIGGVIADALVACDVVLVSGGVSVGDYDYVKNAFDDIGIAIGFHRVAVKPGKPTLFGTKAGRYFFGLPGNPAATFIIFETLVRPFLLRLMGCEFAHRTLTLPVGEMLSRKRSDRQEFVPIAIDATGKVRAVEYHGSAHLHAYTRADGIVSFADGATVHEAGSFVEVTLL